MGRQRAPSGTPELRVVLPALAENASTLRHSLDDWAHAAELSPELIEAMSLAVYEAMANAVEHAYHGRGPGALRMHAMVANGTVVVSVEDDGRWRSPDSEPGLRGRGIPLMEALAGRLDITATSRGTTVRMSWPTNAFSGDGGQNLGAGARCVRADRRLR